MFKVLCDKTDHVQSVKEGGFITYTEVIVNNLILLQWAMSWFLKHQVETTDWLIHGKIHPSLNLAL